MSMTKRYIDWCGDRGLTAEGQPFEHHQAFLEDQRLEQLLYEAREQQAKQRNQQQQNQSHGTEEQQGNKD